MAERNSSGVRPVMRATAALEIKLLTPNMARNADSFLSIPDSTEEISYLRWRLEQALYRHRLWMAEGQLVLGRIETVVGK